MPLMPTAPVIGVCGPIGAGKSTVVRALSRALGFHPWVERVEDNPFFRRYTSDRATWALRSQLAFMIGALEDATAARRRPPGGVLERPAQEMFGVFVCDLQRDGVLAPEEVRTLERLLELGELLAGVPDLLVVLHGDPRVLLERIRARGRPGEDAYTLGDMQRLETAYAAWTGAWDRSPVIDVDALTVDLRTTTGIRWLAAQVRDALGLPA